ncbi:CobQ/CobB/MinD/ParA family nucleotide binding protein [Kribbella rubisoli]|uniref:CobQ/CobB/MinD/ParA family nucleotide binding protein n=1 Tax=Kribbella rubisoli TaxID=3075929 RepID=A0A4Q7WYW1_9ACTN|nr:P-loop NTPase [Kribbella rubisoli]RZU15751.1 CobQ/CobB/MinD/ParA family nucleotide binding protein [Kribbella rubisoli]
MSIPVLLAVTGAPWEADVVQRTERAPGIKVVRRCVDIADVMAAAASGQARAVLLADALARLSSDAVAALHARGIAVLALVDPTETGAPFGPEDRLSRMGIERILPADVSPTDLGRAVTEAVESGPEISTAHFSGGFVPLTPETAANYEPPPYSQGAGRLIAVWGPTGAPGRTTVAVNLASELAAKRVPTLLADADVYGGTVAQMLGMLDETSGLAAAARSASNGSLDMVTLAKYARQVAPHMLVLTGLSRADRWTELRPAAIEAIWSTARELAPITVVDVGFCIETDEEISFDSLAPRRNGATVATLEQADEVMIVGTADPVGLTRLIRAVHEVRAVVPSTNVRVVVNRLRSGALGGSPGDAAADALGQYAGIQPAALLPYDLSAVDAAMSHGRSLADAAKSSKLRKSFQQLATTLVKDLVPA